MQTMNSNPVEGAQADQTLEGRYSDYRYFVEELRNEMVKEGVEGETVYVTMTQIDGSVKIAGLDYGYYLTDEITDVQSTHAAASLILLQTANPLPYRSSQTSHLLKRRLLKMITEQDGMILPTMKSVRLFHTVTQQMYRI